MMKEGYAGARFVNTVVENLWGWQVTVPEVVDAAKWQEIYETYVEDKHKLDIKEKFRQANNLLAYQAMVDRMLVAVKKGYWKASPEVIKRLEKENTDVIKEAGVACTADSCSDPNWLKPKPRLIRISKLPNRQPRKYKPLHPHRLIQHLIKHSHNNPLQHKTRG